MQISGDSQRILTGERFPKRSSIRPQVPSARDPLKSSTLASVGRLAVAWLSACPVSARRGKVTLRGFRIVRARNRRNSLPGSCTILGKLDNVQHFPSTRAHLLALNKLTPISKDPGRGGERGTRPERSPWGSLGGIPLNSLLLPFLLTRKGRAGGVRDDSPAGRGKCREATKGDGARARGLSGPFRRDLRGPIDQKPETASFFIFSVKPSASKSQSVRSR